MKTSIVAAFVFILGVSMSMAQVHPTQKNHKHHMKKSDQSEKTVLTYEKAGMHYASNQKTALKYKSMKSVEPKEVAVIDTKEGSANYLTANRKHRYTTRFTDTDQRQDFARSKGVKKNQNK
jgi:hypothetical protein